MSKPLVFNYRDYDNLRDKCNDMAVEIAELTDKVKAQAEEVIRLKEENTNPRIKCRILQADLDALKTERSDLISRADVLKYPIRLDHYDEVNGSREFVYGVESVIEYVESLPSADAEQGWRIGKPTDQGEYMVTIDSFGHKHIDLFYYGKPLMPNRKVKGKCWYRSDDDWGDVVYDDTDILAWMPLPKPYKGGDDE